MKTIVAAVDFSNSTPLVIKAAQSQAAAFGADLHVIHVLEPQPVYSTYGFMPDEFPAAHLFQTEARKRAETRLAALSTDSPFAQALILNGTALDELLDYATKNAADLIVLGTHGHSAVAALLLGSVAEGAVRKALVPTLVVPAADRSVTN